MKRPDLADLIEWALAIIFLVPLIAAALRFAWIILTEVSR